MEPALQEYTADSTAKIHTMITINKEFERLSKYNDLEIEVCKMWDMKSPTIPLVIGALEVIKEGVNEYLEKIPGSSVIGQMQKIMLLRTVRIFTKSVFNYKYTPLVYGMYQDVTCIEMKPTNYIIIIIIIIIIVTIIIIIIIIIITVPVVVGVVESIAL